MKISFVYLPYLKETEEEEKGVFPPLGVAYIAAVLRMYGHESQIIDMEAENLTSSEVISRISEFEPDVVGLSFVTAGYKNFIALSSKIRDELNIKAIISGGPHISAQPEDAIPYSDIGVIGEGEYTTLEILNTLRMKDNLRQVKGIIFKDKEQIIKTPPRPPIENIDEIPFPARDLLNMELYGDNKGSIMTSRSCPFNCIFCASRQIFGRGFRARSAKNVVDEIELLITKYNVEKLRILDDMFTFDKKRVFEICEIIKERNIKVRWELTNGTRVNSVTPELLKAMKEAGLYRVYYGIESGSPKVLKALRKGITLDQVRKAIKWTKDAGIEVGGFFMIGNPTETIEDVRMTEKLIQELDLDYVHISITTPYPGSDLYKWVEKNARFITKDYEDFEKDFVFDTPDFPIEMRRKIYHELYEKYCSH